MEKFKQSEMLYDDGEYYKWTAKEDQDNPFVRGGKEAKELNRTEGFEVLYFINHNLSIKSDKPLGIYRKVEKMIRYEVPSELKDRTEIEDWIVDNFS